MEYFMKFFNLSGSLLCVISLLIFVDSTPIDYVEESCYGSNGFKDRLQSNCSADEVIYPHDVYTYTKKIETGCPLTSTDKNRNETYCCRYVNETEDCGMRYFGVDVALEHYLPFTGKASGSIQVAWNNTLNICNQSIYNWKTHYMRMTYNCIKSSNIVSMCNGSFTGNPVFLWNDGYPNSDGDCNSTSGCKCAIKSSGGSIIQIDALDLRFARNETTGSCAQRLFVIDGHLESDIACDDVNLFERRTLFTSSTDSIQLRYDNTYHGSTGNFWISAQATDTNQTLSILCSHSDKVDVEYSCGDNFTIISPLTTPSPIETNDTTTPTESTNDTTTPTESTNDITTPTESTIVTTTPTASTHETIMPTESHATSTSTESLSDTLASTGSTSDTITHTESTSDTFIPAESTGDTLTPTESLSDTFMFTESTTPINTSPVIEGSKMPSTSSYSTSSTSTSMIKPTSSYNTLPASSMSSSSTTTSLLTQSTVASKSTGEESTSKGPIIGAIIGAVVVSATAGLIAYSLWRKKFKASYQVDPDYDTLFDNSDVINSRPPERMTTFTT